MKSHVKTKTSQVLELDSKEAAWLKGLMQNPLCPQDKEESDEDEEMRTKIFEALIWTRKGE